MESKEYERLAHRAYRESKYREAAKYFERACEQHKDKRTLYWLGLCFYKLEKYEQAIDRFSQALAIDGKFKNAWIAKGDALVLAQRFIEAATCYGKALKLEPWNDKVREKKEQLESIWSY